MNWIMAQTIILTITFIAIGWYTWETRRLRILYTQQLELQKKPRATLRIKKFPENYETEVGCKFLIKNCGYCGAFNIEIESPDLQVEYDHQIYLIKFYPVPALWIGEEKELKVILTQNGRQICPGYKELRAPVGSFDKKYEAFIHYENPHGQKFEDKQVVFYA